MNTRTVAAIGVVALLVLAPGTSSAQSREDGAPAMSLGTGDAVRASAVGSSALYFNPGGMPRLKQYAIEAGYSFLNTLGGHSFGVGMVDSATNDALAMGFQYNYVLGKRDGRDREGHNLRGGLATGYATKDFAIYGGLGVRYTNFIVGAGDDPKNAESDDIEFFTLDAGLVLTISDMFRIGVVGQNLLDAKNVREAPRSVGVGVGLQLEAFELNIDANLDIQTDPETPLVSWHFGAQYLIENLVVVRLGFVYDQGTDDKRIAGGASYVSKLVGVDLGFQQSIDNGDDTIFSLGVRVFLP